jgi:YfiH family protein
MQNHTLFFGNKADAVPVAVFNANNFAATQKIDELTAAHKLKKIIFPFQIHGTQGLVINDDISVASFTREADWLITNQPGLGIGVLTADCVPILIYDPVQHAVAAVHAGWRGAVDGVVIAALAAMQQYFGSQPADLQVWIGPHARTCCYQVDQKFYEAVMQKQFGTASWHKKGEQLFFDLTHCCIDQLIAAGVRMQQVADTGICTVCTPEYSSYRREKEAALRNISFVGLR